MLTPAEKKIAKVLLERAADKFSNHECNDFDVVKEAGLTKEDSDALWKSLGDFDDPEFAGNLGTCHLDWVLMQYLATKMVEEG